MNNIKMLYMLYCNLVGFFNSILQEEEKLEESSANCVAGKRQDDCLNVSPDVEALSWLSASCPSLVSLCIS